ncbi:cyclin-like protein [Podospora conica]|nr:cyclin-like protein [Schizothecium conicum]
MSTADRYRPVREGYQPPTLPSKPMPIAAITEPASSKSPGRRRDVPPAVPSPPSYTSRTSPPRPHSRRSAPSPGASSTPQRTSQMATSQWVFTEEEVASSPSVLDGLTPAEERLRRVKGVNFIIQAGILLKVPHTTIWVAGVFFHRFYMRMSMAEELKRGGIHHYNIAATALFLANKTEENCKKTKELIIAVAKVAQKNVKLEIDEQSKEYWRWRDSILAYEELMLEMLTFDLMITPPYTRLYDHLTQLGVIESKSLRDSGWTFLNDSTMTVLPLLVSANDLAVAAVFFAGTMHNQKFGDVRGEPWWRALGGNEASINKVVATIVEFYQENPLRKQDVKVPGSPAFNLENTRRRGENTGDGSSHCGTPMGTDRGTQSPRAVPASVNGRAESVNHAAEAIKKGEARAGGDQGSSSMSFDVDSQNTKGDSDATLKMAANELSVHENTAAGDGLVSPVLPGSKRKSDDMDIDSDERDAKRAKTVDEDEGEIPSSS